MDINVDKYRPIILKTEVNKMEKIEKFNYFIEKNSFMKILELIPKKDIDIEELKYFLFNLNYIENEEEISTWIYKIKVKSSSKKIEGLEYCYYYVFLKYYESINREIIYNSITKLGKSTFKYMSLPKNNDNFLNVFQKMFQQGKNITFFNFLYEELKKRISLNSFNFFQEFYVSCNSKLAKDLIEKYISEISKSKEIKDKKIIKNIEILKMFL